MKVAVYWNFHKNLYSVKALDGSSKGRVIAHCHRVSVKDSKFKVSECGRQRVLRDRRKNVHAWIAGDLVHFAGSDRQGSDLAIRYAEAVATPTSGGSDAVVSVYYNPYCNESFVTERGDPIHRADTVSCAVVSGKPRVRASLPIGEHVFDQAFDGDRDLVNASLPSLDSAAA